MTQEATPHPEILRTRDFVGWEVVERAGDKVGSVADLLIDRSGRVRFMDVEYGLPRKHFLLPEHALEWGEGKFVIGAWNRDQLRLLPPYETDRPLDAPVLEEMERAFPWLYRAGWAEAEGPPAETRVVPMSEAKDFRLESGAPDIRGWNVFGSDGERIGTVSRLLVDPAGLKVRYLDVDLLDDLFQLRDDRHVLVPLEHVDLKERGNDIWVRRLTAREVARFPAYLGGPVPPWQERMLGEAFG